MAERKVQILPGPEHGRTRVVIYCRVSSARDAQIHSLTNQLQYLTGEVADNPEWELVNVYLDIKSGANAEGRGDLQRMLADARDHKFDLILIKSCSRFFRNVTQALTVLHELDDLGVEVRFDEEGQSSKDSTFWLYVTLYETAAEHFNAVRSDSIKWGIRKSAEAGTSSLYDRKCYGYMNDEEGRLIVNPEEAPIVSPIFKLYLDGYSVVKIIKELQARGIPSPTGKETWCKHTIEVMLTNVKYTGDSAVLKTSSEGYEKKKRVLTKSILCAEDDHEPIVSRETFAAVQEEKARRSNVVRDENGTHRSSKKYSSKSSIKQADGVNA